MARPTSSASRAQGTRRAPRWSDPVTGATVRDEPDGPLLEDAAQTFSMLASPTRLHLLWLLARGEWDVGSLAAAVGGSVAMVSQHLAKLRLANLVSARREGKRQIYVVDDPHVVTLIDQALDHHRDLRS
jgi:DNA-binding transcriptional ArsR family regulator